LYRYKNTQPTRIRIPDAFNVEVDPGEEFDSEELLNNPTLVPADEATKAAHDARDAAWAAEAQGLARDAEQPLHDVQADLAAGDTVKAEVDVVRAQSDVEAAAAHPAGTAVDTAADEATP